MSGALSVVSDTGGTNTRCALARGQNVEHASVRRYRNAGHADLASVLRTYLEEVRPDAPLAGACAAVAGPVLDGTGRLTNLDWTIDREMLECATGAGSVSVLNDLQAQGHAIGHIDPALETRIAEGVTPGAQAAKLVVGVGTGFNAAPVYDTPDGRYVPPSEAGHAGLPISTEEEFRLVRWVARQTGFTSVEDALSGRGVERIYAWLSEEAGRPARLSAAEVMSAASAGTDSLAEEALHVFVRLFGSVVGNLTLNYLPFGGVYLCGGVARHFGPWLPRLGFLDAFYAKGRFSQFMRQFPVTVVEDDYAALTGCAAHLSQLIAPEQRGS